MKNYYILFLTFLLLGAATITFLFFRTRESKSTLGWYYRFKVEKQEDIEKIFLARRDGISTTFEHRDGFWTVNGKYKARPNAVENLLEAITKVEVMFVPAKAAMDNIVSELASRGIKVEVYGKSDKKLKAYYVGGVTADARGTYMIMENAEQPLVTGLPMMEGQIRARYDLTGDDWRDRTVFSYSADEIDTVSIEYPLQRNKSFRLMRRGGDFQVLPFYGNIQPIAGKVNKGMAESFLQEFGSLVAENFINQYEKQDSILQMVPFSIVNVTSNKSGSKQVTFYPTYRENASTGLPTAEVIERYFAKTSDGDFMLVQHRVFENIFWAYESFFK
jgi:hypothetical protein